MSTIFKYNLSKQTYVGSAFLGLSKALSDNMNTVPPSIAPITVKIASYTPAPN
jgi:hypothetical protein